MVITVLVATSVIVGVGGRVAIALIVVGVCLRWEREDGDDYGCDTYWYFTNTMAKVHRVDAFANVCFQPNIPLALMSLIFSICCMMTFVINVGSIAAMLMRKRTTHRLPGKGLELRLFGELSVDSERRRFLLERKQVK